jgi:glutathione S-transferase
MKLYFSSGACSFAEHIILREAGLPFELVKVDTGAHKTSDGRDYYAINPKGYVPALQLDDGQVLTEGAALLQYLGDLAPAAGLIPAPGTLERFRANEWLTFVSSEIHKGFSPLFNKELSADAKQVLSAKLQKRFDWLEQHFAKHSYLMGDKFTVADAYLFTVVSWSGHVGIDLGKWKNLSAFVERVGSRPKVREALHSEKQAA